MLGEAEERYTKKQKRVIATQETMQPTETNCEKAKVLDLEEKPFKAVIINVIKELEKLMHKEVKEYIMTMSHHTKNINRELEITDETKWKFQRFNKQSKNFIRGAEK